MLCGAVCALLCGAVVRGAKGVLCGAKAVLVVHCVVHRAVHCAVHCVRVPGIMQPCMLDGGLCALAAVGAAGVRVGRRRRRTVAHQLLERGGALLAWGE